MQIPACKSETWKNDKRKKNDNSFRDHPRGFLTTSWQIGSLQQNVHPSVIIFQASDLGLVKDTPGWPSPISSCVGPPWISPKSSGVRMRLETMIVFFSPRANRCKNLMT